VTLAPARPFLKWAGGKGKLLSQLRAFLPRGVERMRHVEPFAGGAALYFESVSATAWLSDINEKLMHTYRAVRDDLEQLLVHLAELARDHSAARYYEVREQYNWGGFGRGAELGAAFIYLNRTCFNGLYRVNRDGRFNVPIGRYAHPTILDEAALRAASENLRRAELGHGDFATVLTNVGRGDFVFLDPPYQPVSKTAGFRSYARDGFSLEDQERLRDAFAAAARRGARLLLTNSDTREVRRLYRGWSTSAVLAQRSINSDPSGRGIVRELVVRSYA
jgi:DNA adenine methylase